MNTNGRSACLMQTLLPFVFNPGTVHRTAYGSMFELVTEKEFLRRGISYQRNIATMAPINNSYNGSANRSAQWISPKDYPNEIKTITDTLPSDLPASYGCNITTAYRTAY